jgi:hypothetical protein
MAILVYNLFDFFRFYVVLSDMLDIILVPLRFQFLESHVGKVSYEDHNLPERNGLGYGASSN